MSLKRLAIALVSIGILALAVLYIYSPSLTIGFFADDYNFMDPVVRMSVPEYLVRYFDPRLQTMWYRPLQGVQFLVEYTLFGPDGFGYHLVNILFHAVNAALLFGLVWRISGKWHLGFVSAAFYISFPVYAYAINYVNITDPLMTVFYLLGIWFWWSYLHEGRRVQWAATLVLFLLALLSKQLGATLPVTLFLLDRWMVGKPASISQLVRRYAGFVPILALFAVIQLSARMQGFAGVFGYTFGPHMASILVQYLSLAVFPWGYYPPVDTQITEGMPFADAGNLLWMSLAIILFIVVLWRTRSRVLMFLGCVLVLTLLPVLPFPFVELRYLYVPSMASAILLAMMFDVALTTLRRPRILAATAGVVLALLLWGTSFAVANATSGIYELARQRRVPFRDISRQHAAFSPGTLLYFVDPITPASELSGMFALRYGSSVTVGADNWGQVAALRDRSAAFVYYFDETGKPYEIAIDAELPLQSSPALPSTFAAPLRLEGYELANPTTARGQAMVALLYWRALAPIDKDYTMFIHLLDAKNQMVAGYDSPPRKGAAPTSTWEPNRLVVDAVVLHIPEALKAGSDYRLEVGVHDSKTMQRLSLANANSDSVIIAPIKVIEP